MKTYYFTSPTSEAKPVGTTGRLFKKQVLPLGEWVDPLYPGEKMSFTREFFEQMVYNFKKAVVGRVPTPDTHTDATEANKGEVVDLAVEDDGLYAYLDIRDEDAAEGIDRGTTWDVSAKFTDNYQDTKEGQWHGPALLHVALVNNPYIKKMNPFVALADALHSSQGAAVRALSESTNIKEEPMKEKVANTKDFPVEVTLTEDGEDKKVVLQPGEEVEVVKEDVDVVKLQIDAAEAPKEEGAKEEAGEEEKPADKAEEEEGEDTKGEQARTDRQQEAAKKANDEDLAAQSDIPPAGEGTENTDGQKPKTEELSETARELAETKHKLAMRDIDDRYKELLKQGKLVPALEQPFKQLSEAVLGQSRQLSDGSTVSLSEALTRFTDAMPKIVSLDDEKGKTDEETQNSPWQKLSDKQREGLQASGITEEQYNAQGGKNGFSVTELTKKKED